MSFEGFYQVLCVDGHYHEIDAHDLSQRLACDYLIEGKPCGAMTTWQNLVDDTNCDRDGYVEMVELTPSIFRVCDLGHSHIWSDKTVAPITDGALNLLARTAPDA